MKFKRSIDHSVGKEFFEWVIKVLTDLPDVELDEVLLVDNDKVFNLKLTAQDNIIEVHRFSNKSIQIITTCTRLSECRDSLLDEIEKIKEVTLA